MAVQTISYTNKVDLNTTATADINKVKASDLNEIKTVVNNNANEVETRSGYSTTETAIGTWTDGSTLYRKVFEVNIDTTSTGWKEVGSLTHNNIVRADFVCTTSTEPTRYRTNCNNFCNLSFANNKCYTAGTGTFTGTLYLKTVIVEYTKSS